jgi:hypothetical protein
MQLTADGYIAEMSVPYHSHDTKMTAPSYL